MSENAVRTPKEVMRSHGKALLNGDLDGVVANYSEDAVFITPAGAHRGRDGVRTAQSQVLRELANARFTYHTQIAEGDVMFIEWSAEGEDFTVADGVDTLIFDRGEIKAQTLRYTKRPKGEGETQKLAGHD